MADVPTSLVGENGLAGRKKSLLGEQIHYREKIHLLRRPNLTRGGSLGGWDNVPTLAIFFVMAPLMGRGVLWMLLKRFINGM